jgi:hypothetical protein
MKRCPSCKTRGFSKPPTSSKTRTTRKNSRVSLMKSSSRSRYRNERARRRSLWPGERKRERGSDGSRAANQTVSEFEMPVVWGARPHLVRTGGLQVNSGPLFNPPVSLQLRVGWGSWPGPWGRSRRAASSLKNPNDLYHSFMSEESDAEWNRDGSPQPGPPGVTERRAGAASSLAFAPGVGFGACRVLTGSRHVCFEWIVIARRGSAATRPLPRRRRSMRCHDSLEGRSRTSARAPGGPQAPRAMRPGTIPAH